MKTWIMPRGTGKTTQLVLESAERGSVIVAPNNLGVKLAIQRAEEMGVEIKTPITFKQLFENKTPGERYIVDELGMVLRGLNIVGYSDTTKEMNDIAMSEWQERKKRWSSELGFSHATNKI